MGPRSLRPPASHLMSMVLIDPSDVGLAAWSKFFSTTKADPWGPRPLDKNKRIRSVHEDWPPFLDLSTSSRSPGGNSSMRISRTSVLALSPLSFALSWIASHNQTGSLIWTIFKPCSVVIKPDRILPKRYIMRIVIVSNNWVQYRCWIVWTHN